MRWKIALVAVLLFTVGIYFIVIPYFSGEKPNLVKGKTPVEVLREVKKRGAELENFTYRSKVNMGNTMSVSLTSRSAPPENRELITFSWKSPQGYGEASMYRAGKKVYIHHPLKGIWFKPEEEPGVGQLAKIFIGQLGIINPYRSLERLKLEELEATNTGTEIFEGIENVVIEVKADSKIYKVFEEVLPPQLVGANIVDVKQIYWIGTEDLLINKYLLTAQVKFFGLKAADFKAQTTLKDFNNTEIKIPAKLQSKLR